MKSILNEMTKTAIALVLGLIGMWFLLSFQWSPADMSPAEKVAGVIWSILVVPIYEGIKRVLRLR